MFKKRTSAFNLWLISVLVFWWLCKFFCNVWTGVDGFGFLAHKTCIDWVEDHGSYDFLNLKILCSYNNFHNTSEKSDQIFAIFKSLSLIHLLVASGSHLIILKQGVDWIMPTFTKSKWPMVLTLFVFVAGSNFSGPVTRCFFQIVISLFVKRFSLNWRPIPLTLLSSMIYLGFFPEAFFTLSFWLSVSASLILATFGQSPLILSLVFYLSLFPFIIDFAKPQLSAILVNIILTPVIAPLLIYNSIFNVVIPGFPFWGDKIIELLLKILSGFNTDTADLSPNPLNLSLKIKILYGFVLSSLIFSFQYLRSKALKAKLNL